WMVMREALQILVRAWLLAQSTAKAILRDNQLDQIIDRAAQFREASQVILNTRGLANLETMLQVGTDQFHQQDSTALRRTGRQEVLDAGRLTGSPGLLETIEDVFRGRTADGAVLGCGHVTASRWCCRVAVIMAPPRPNGKEDLAAAGVSR